MKMTPNLAILIILMLASCATEGSYTAEGLSLALDVSEGDHAFITLPYEDKVIVTGEAFPEEDGSWVFYTDSLEWFGNWEKGWTEVRFALSGRLRLIPRGTSWEWQIEEKPRIEAVQEGSLRYGEDKYHHDRARDMISRRWTRIEAAAVFAGDRLVQKDYSFTGKRETFASPSYMKDLESLLFPEIYGYPADYPEPNESGGHRYERAEEILWDTWYSETYIDEELRPVRNSGTLYRDYREGRGLFFLALTWERMWGREIPRSIIELKEE